MAVIKKREWQFVGIVFLISMIVRTVLGCYYPRTVNCYPDEILYLSAAESLWNHHQVLVFGLPTDFGKIGYSILMAPVFALSDLHLRGVWISVISAVVMSLGIFPIYALAAEILENEKFRRWSAVFYTVSPTMTYSMTYTSEVLFIPLMVTLLYLLYLLLAKKVTGKKMWIVLGASCLVWFISYLTKELVLVIPLALAVSFGVDFWQKRKKENRSISWKTVLLLAGILLACAGIYLISNRGSRYYQLGFDLAFLQERGWYLLYGTLFFVAASLLAFLLIPVLYPLVFGRELEESTGRFFRFLLYILGITAFVVSYTIYLHEDYPSLTPRAHIRYVEYLFVPFVICLFSLLERKRPKVSLKHLGILGVVLVFCLVLFQGFNGQTIDQTMLFMAQVFSEDGHVFLPYKARIFVLLLIVVVVILTVLFYNDSKLFISLLLSGMMLAALGNTILSAYVQYQTHTHSTEETAEAEWIRDFVRKDKESSIAVLEPDSHEELLDTFLADCDNVYNIGIADGWYYALTEGDIETYGLWAEGDIIRDRAYESVDSLQYLLICDDTYVTEETENVEEVRRFPAMGYTLYELKDTSHLPKIQTLQ